MSPARRAGSAPPEALTVDAWYTLLYITPSEHRRILVRRRRLWSAPFLAAGLSRSRVDALLARRDAVTLAGEAAGRTPPIREQVALVARWAGVRVDADEVAESLDRGYARSEVRIAPGATGTLRALSDAGVPVALLSNVLHESGRAARRKLADLGLLSEFRAVVLSCEHPWAKPSPELFRLACRFLEVPPGRAAHLGDLAYDVGGARSAGMRGWWYIGLSSLNGYLRGQVRPGSVPPEEVVHRWSELPGRLRVARR